MSELVPIQFGTQYAVHKSSPFSSELAENLYLEKAPPGAKTPYILLGTPGLSLFATVGTGPIRGARFMAGYLYVVSGGKVYRIDHLANVELIGDIVGTGLVSMETNGTHVWVATGGILYAVNEFGTLDIADGFGISYCTYQDGFLVGVFAGTQKMILSASDDATIIDPTVFTTVDSLPGMVTACVSNHREISAFKEDSIEFYYNAGAADFPFSRTQIVERGCVAPFSVAKFGGAVFFLGDDLQVYSMQAYQPTVVSTPPVAQAIKNQTSPQTATGFCYQQDGHVFYELSFTALTLVYDATTGLWHKRSTFGADAHNVRALSFSNLWRKNIVGDTINGNLYELTNEVYTDNSAQIVRRARGTNVSNNGKRFVIDEFFLDIETGVGLAVGVGSDPQVGLKWSADGGKTYGSVLQRSIGRIGEYKTRVIWNALGAYHSWIPEITIADPVPIRILGAGVKITPLAA